MLPLRIFKISGKSMEPGITPGSFVLIFTWRVNYTKGDEVILKYAGDYQIKRIASVKGDYFEVLGDNQSHSFDSRDYGLVSRKQIVGKVIYKLN